MGEKKKTKLRIKENPDLQRQLIMLLRQICYARVQALVEKSVLILTHGMVCLLLVFQMLALSTLNSQSLQRLSLYLLRANTHHFM